MKRVYVKEEWCLGCHLCEYNCVFANSGERNMAEALKGKPIFPRIHIDQNKCVGCLTCVLVCPYGALAPNEKGIMQKCELCIATGSSPFVPPFTGLESVEQKHSFMTMDDMLELKASINENSNVLIVGAGLIGLKCAAMMQKHLEENSIQFLLGDSVVSFEKNQAVMKSGKTVTFDVLVLAVGVRANTSLIKEIGGEVNRGILINTKMETSIPDIYAAGDCTEGEDISFHGKRVLAILPNAYMQGNCAGIYTSLIRERIPLSSIDFDRLKKTATSTAFSVEKRKQFFGGVV